MFRSKEEEQKYIQKKMLAASLLGAPGTILLGLGLYGKFDANGEAFVSVLNNPAYVNGFIVLGGVIMIWEFVVVFRLAKRIRDKRGRSL